MTTETIETNVQTESVTALFVMKMIRGMMRSLKLKLPDSLKALDIGWMFIRLSNRAAQPDWKKVESLLNEIRHEIGDDKVADKVIRVGLGKEGRSIGTIGDLSNTIVGKAKELREMEDASTTAFEHKPGEGIWSAMNGQTLANLICCANPQNDLLARA